MRKSDGGPPVKKPKKWSSHYRTHSLRLKKFPQQFYQDYQLYSLTPPLSSRSILNMRTSSSKVIPVVLDAAGDSPWVQALFQRFSDIPSCYTPSYTAIEGRCDPLDETIILSPQKIKTPGGTSYVRVIDYGVLDSCRVALFQDEEAGTQKKRPANHKNSSDVVQAVMRRPQSLQGEIGPVRIDQALLERQQSVPRLSARWFMGNVNATDIFFMMMGVLRYCEFSHNWAHSQGGCLEDGISVAPAEHNSLRLVAVESAIKELVHFLTIFYRDSVEYLPDANNRPTAVIQRERVTLSIESGECVFVNFNPLQGITPARELKDFANVIFFHSFKVACEKKDDVMCSFGKRV